MKTIINTFVLMLLAFPFFAQEINEMDKIMSLGNKNAFVIDHDRANKKMAEKCWESYMKEYGKAKRNRKAKEYETLEAKISLISSDKLGVYYIAEEGNGQATSFIFFDDGSQFMSSENAGDKIESIYTFLTPFVFEVEKAVIQEDLDNEEKTLKGLNKDLEKLEKTNKNLHKDIEDWKKKIAEAEAAIEQNLVDQENKKTEISNQEGVVEKTIDKLNSVGRG